MNHRLLEVLDFQPFFVPIDTQGASGGHIDGDWLHVGDCDQFAVVFLKEAGTANDDPTLTIQQATSAAGADAKALTFTKFWSKQSAAENLTAVGTWTENTQSALSTVVGNSTSAESSLVYWVEFRCEDMDKNNGFKFVNATVADTGTAGAQWGTAFLIKGTKRFSDKPTNHASAIAAP